MLALDKILNEDEKFSADKMRKVILPVRLSSFLTILTLLVDWISVVKSAKIPPTKQVEIVQNYSVFSVFNATRPVTSGKELDQIPNRPGSSAESLIRHLDFIR